ncbi:hypothetical protein GCM10009825_26330 [Arthrobacter humicola]|uniref:Uncharacterized protein n=1 Tax=Arthrobacter humicola TaxID=409291 RepID=A0ABN2ZAX0_9MICC
MGTIPVMPRNAEARAMEASSTRSRNAGVVILPAIAAPPAMPRPNAAARKPYCVSVAPSSPRARNTSRTFVASPTTIKNIAPRTRAQTKLSRRIRRSPSSSAGFAWPARSAAVPRRVLISRAPSPMAT